MAGLLQNLQPVSWQLRQHLLYGGLVCLKSTVAALGFYTLAVQVEEFSIPVNKFYSAVHLEKAEKSRQCNHARILEIGENSVFGVCPLAKAVSVDLRVS